MGLAFATLAIGLQWAYVKKHNFVGQCQICHASVPSRDTPFEAITFTDQLDRLCARCHKLQERTSHPVGVMAQGAAALQRYLDKEGRLTCVTCHDVHKEDRPLQDATEAKGLLRGHVRGREFCAACHNERSLGASWRHGLAVPYAHPSGKLVQSENGSTVDRFSVECLSCHDGVISKLGKVTVRQGEYQHGIGITHPIGVGYPRGGISDEYVAPEQLPKAIQLFDGKVGCLSCHSLYGGGKDLLVMDNMGSALCVSCHRK